jgi:hypothetical protein
MRPEVFIVMKLQVIIHGFLGCHTAQYGGWKLTAWRTVLPLKMKAAQSYETMTTTTTLHSATTQKQ